MMPMGSGRVHPLALPSPSLSRVSEITISEGEDDEVKLRQPMPLHPGPWVSLEQSRPA